MRHPVPGRLPAGQVTQDARERMFDAAVAAFADKGFHATTTRDIAAAAGMSPAALYVHYASKEELLYLIARQGHERTLDLVRTAATGHGSAGTRLQCLMHAFALDHAERHTEARVINYELDSLSADHLAEIRDVRQQIDGVVRQLVEEGIGQSEFTCEDARMAATAILSLGVDIARWYTEGLAWRPADVASQYADIALRIVGARPDGAPAR